MDAPRYSSWRHLYTQVCDRDFWRVRVRALRQMSIVSVIMGPHVECRGRENGVVHGERINV